MDFLYKRYNTVVNYSFDRDPLNFKGRLASAVWTEIVYRISIRGRDIVSGNVAKQIFGNITNPFLKVAYR